MKPEKLTTIKKELTNLSVLQLTDICLRLSKYKKENKELLSYLLFEADDPMRYADSLKELLEEDYMNLSGNPYYSIKVLRKILRLLTRHVKYTASKQVEVELLLWFCTNFLKYADTRTHNKALKAIFIRQIQKIAVALKKLHEDLQFDYHSEFELLVNNAHTKVRDFNKYDYLPVTK